MKVIIFFAIVFFSCNNYQKEKKGDIIIGSNKKDLLKIDSSQQIMKKIQGEWQLTTDSSIKLHISHDTVFQRSSIGVDTLKYKIFKNYINGADTIMANSSTFIILYYQDKDLLFHEFITNLTSTSLVLMGENESQSTIYKRLR